MIPDAPARIWVWGANNAGQLGLGYLSEQVSSPTELVLPSKPTVDTSHLEQFSDARNSMQYDETQVYVDRTVLAIQGGGSHTLILNRCHFSAVAADEAKNLKNGVRVHMSGADSSHSQRDHWYEIVNFGLISTKLAFPTEATWFPSTNVGHVARIPQIACGWDFSLYLNSDGQLFSCGDNNFGQLGRACNEIQPNMTYAPVQVDRFNCVQISAGLRHAAAICVDQRSDYPDEFQDWRPACLMVWGDNSKKQLGLGVAVKVASIPTKVVLHNRENQPVPVAKVKCGKHFTLARAKAAWNGLFYGAGLDKFGIFGCDSGGNGNGNGGGKPVYLPEFTQLDLAFPQDCDLMQVKDFQCGWNHILVLLENGRILSWGRNNFFQLGRSSGSREYDWVPNYVQEGLPDYKLDPVISIACGSEHNLALTKSGQVYAWGWNEHENCGIVIKNSATDDVIKRPTLVQIPTPTPIQSPACANSETDIGTPSSAPIENTEKVVRIGCGAGNSFAITTRKLEEV